MLKTSTIAACVLALSGSVAMAQSNSSSGWMPPGPNNAPYGANGAAPAHDIGSPTANATDTAAGGTQSTTGLSQNNKLQSAAGTPSSNYGQAMPAGQSAGAQAAYGSQQAQAPYGAQSGMQPGPMTNPNAAYITDEYGYKYNSRGERIGRVRH